MSVNISPNGANAAQPSADPRIAQYANGGRTRPGASASPASATADSAVHVDVTAAVGRQNAASAATDVNDLAAAQTLVKQLVSQLSGQPAGAGSTPGSPSPRAVLSLLN